MIKEKLNELGMILEQNPTSPQALALASEIKNACATPEEEKLVENFIGSRISALSDDISQLHEDATRLQLGEIDEIINLSYIAKTYFKKSRAWLSQRINGNIVNGKPCRFTPDELDTFNAALHDISLRLSKVTVKY